MIYHLDSVPEIYSDDSEATVNRKTAVISRKMIGHRIGSGPGSDTSDEEELARRAEEKEDERRELEMNDRSTSSDSSDEVSLTRCFEALGRFVTASFLLRSSSSFLQDEPTEAYIPPRMSCPPMRRDWWKRAKRAREVSVCYRPLLIRLKFNEWKIGLALPPPKIMMAGGDC